MTAFRRIATDVVVWGRCVSRKRRLPSLQIEFGHEQAERANSLPGRMAVNFAKLPELLRWESRLAPPRPCPPMRGGRAKYPAAFVDRRQGHRVLEMPLPGWKREKSILA
jgi:hypothetical protein